MNLICPFLSHLPTGTDLGEYYLCPGDCALWVISEEMCSFRLLADKIVYARELRKYGSEGKKEKP